MSVYREGGFTVLSDFESTLFDIAAKCKSCGSDRVRVHIIRNSIDNSSTGESWAEVFCHCEACSKQEDLHTDEVYP